MERSQIKSVIDKYRKLANEAEMECDDDRAFNCNHFAEDIEENIAIFEGDSYQTEEDLLDDYRSNYDEDCWKYL